VNLLARFSPSPCSIPQARHFNSGSVLNARQFKDLFTIPNMSLHPSFNIRSGGPPAVLFLMAVPIIPGAPLPLVASLTFRPLALASFRVCGCIGLPPPEPTFLISSPPFHFTPIRRTRVSFAGISLLPPRLASIIPETPRISPPEGDNASPSVFRFFPPLFHGPGAY